MINHKKNTTKVKYIIYENNDTELLLNCEVRTENKIFLTDIPIGMLSFVRLFEKRKNGSEEINKIASKLFNSGYPINHISPKNIINTELLIKNKEILPIAKSFNKSA